MMLFRRSSLDRCVYESHQRGVVKGRPERRDLYVLILVSRLLLWSPTKVDDELKEESVVIPQ